MEHSDFDVFQFAPFSGLRNTLGPVHSVFVAPAGSTEEDAGTSFVNRANAAFGLHFIRSVEAHAPNTPITYIAIYAGQLAWNSGP